MIYLIQYDRSAGKLVRLQEFPSDKKKHAEETRLCVELELLETRVSQKLGSEVGAIWPNERVQLGVDPEGLEIFDVPEWLEYLAVKFRTQIHFALGSIIELDPDGVAGHVARFFNPRQHTSYSNGSIRGNGLLARASVQVSCSSC